MYQHASPYPVRAVSRSVARRSMRRASWFVMGAGFGVGCALTLTTTMTPMTPFSWDVAHNAPNLSMSLVKELNSAQNEPAARTGIQVTALALPSPEKSEIIDEKAEKEEFAAAEPAEPVQLQFPEEAETDKTLAAPVNYPLLVDMKVGSGDTLMNILTDTGVSYQEAHNVVHSIRSVYNPKSLDVGQNVTVVLDKHTENKDELIISSLSLPVSVTDTVEVTRDAKSGFSAKTIKADLQSKPVRAAGRIESSLYETARAGGVPSGVLSELINAFSYDVDFQRDIQPGDNIEVMFEQLRTEGGEVAGHGRMLFAELHTGNKELKIYRYTDKNGISDYYNAKGESVRKALLRTPINGARITSSFGMRSHPILGYTKMHRGVDFGAPTGTPIYAAGDGVVSFVGKKGGYGNYVMIKHDKKYSSAYAHVSRFAKGMTPGKKVQQGQIIAYVGTTGRSTGPHLHYEILVNDVQVNPSGVKFKTGNVLTGRELAAFKQNVKEIHSQLAKLPDARTRVAMAE